MDNKTNSNKGLQFTELTHDDMVTHEDLYLDTLPKGTFMSKQWKAQLYNYNFKELQKAMQLFRKTFK